jgi:hypothetical protein
MSSALAENTSAAEELALTKMEATAIKWMEARLRNENTQPLTDQLEAELREFRKAERKRRREAKRRRELEEEQRAIHHP